MTMEQIALRIQAQVDAGAITYDQGLTLLSEAAAIHAGGPVPEGIVDPPAPDPRKAEAIKLTDRELLVSALQATGQNEVEALRTAVATDVGTQAQIITAERNRLQNLADRKASDAFDRTPEGKLERGNALAAERAEEAKLIAPARELLREQGLSDADIDAVAGNTTDLLVMAGLREAPIVRRQTNSRMVNEGLEETTKAIGAALAADAAKDAGESNA
jgi:hypothetical protein